MNEKLYEICKEILGNEVEAEKFMKMQNVDEIYEYLKIKIPELSKDEFEDFIIDTFEQYKEKCENEQKSGGAIDDDDLEAVAGGVNLGTRIASAGLALMALLPAVGAKNIKNDDLGYSSSTSISQSVNKETSGFQKVTNWVKNHKTLVAGVAIATIIVGGVAYKVHSNNKAKAEAEAKAGKKVGAVAEISEKQKAVKESGNKKIDAEKAALIKAVEGGDLAAVKELIGSGVDVNTADKDGTVLMKAAERGNLDIVRYLVENKADVNVKGGLFGQQAALDIAASGRGNLEIVKCLVEKGGANVQDSSALVEASSSGNLSVVRYLIEHKANVNKYNIYEGNPLNRAAASGHLEVVRELIKNGAHVNEHNPLSHAAARGHLDVVEELIRSGANVRGSTTLIDILNHKFGGGLYKEKEKADIVDILLKNGVDVNKIDESAQMHNGVSRTALLAAAVNIYSGCKGDNVDWVVDIANKLVDKGAKLNISNPNGDTALHYIIDSELIESNENIRKLVHKMVDAGADLNKKNNHGEPAWWSVHGHGFGIVKDLLDKGKINASEVQEMKEFVEQKQKAEKDGKLANQWAEFFKNY